MIKNSIPQNTPPNQNTPDVWQDILKHLRGQSVSVDGGSRFSGATGRLTSNNEYTIYATDENKRAYMEKRLSKQILRAIQSVLGASVAVAFAVKERAAVVREKHYTQIGDLYEDEPESGGSDLGLDGAYQNQHNAIIQPLQVEVHTQYFRTKWRPLLGPLLSELVRELRQRCNRKSNRIHFKTTYKSLALALGVSERTIKRALAHDASGKFKYKHLNSFIKSLEVLKESDGKGSIRNTGTCFIIYLDEPLTPDDKEIYEGDKMAPSKVYEGDKMAPITKGQNGT